MRYLDELFRLNKQNIKKLKPTFIPNLKRSVFVFNTKGKNLDSLLLASLFGITNTFFNKYNSGGYILIIQLHTMQFVDKNVYMFLDLLTYYILKNAKFKLEVYVCPEYNDDNGVPISIGFENTAIYRFIKQHNTRMDYSDCKRNFIEFYEKGFQVSMIWFKRFLTREVLDNNFTTSKVISEISSFLKNTCTNKETALAITDAVSEFMSNTEHNNGDCLIDINIYKNHIYISFINLFNARLFDKLKEMHKNHTLVSKADGILNKAYAYHKGRFFECYTEDDFYFISAFQSNITTRDRLSGGTGLTTAVNALANQVVLRESYVLSGDNVIQFKKGLLGSNHKVIGFNENNDYYNGIPNIEVINRCALYIPGVVFQLGLEII